MSNGVDQNLSSMKLSELSIPNLQRSASLAYYTTMRVGGPADALVVAETADELAGIVTVLWKTDFPFMILGGGSNVLVSDAGVHGVVVINRTRPGEGFRFTESETLDAEPPTVWVEAGVNFGALARQAALRGLSGLEWASGIPGTVGGAVIGNAGAHGSDMAGTLVVAEILHPFQGRQLWPVERLEYRYRGSVLKGKPAPQPQAIVLSATLRLTRSAEEAVQAKMNAIAEKRRRIQPPGASMGSMFRNPPGDYAGRLIDAAGLKGTCVGGAEISSRHANFFINHGNATAADIQALIMMAQKAVADKFGVKLELEIILVGDFPDLAP
jgi:UDP-N-acetylmuramate dehydrogenase